MSSDNPIISAIRRSGGALPSDRERVGDFTTRRPTGDDAKRISDAAEAAVERAVAAIDPEADAVDKRNVRHARVLNLHLMTMRDAGREYFTPDDVSDLYGALHSADRTAGVAPAPLHPAFFMLGRTSAVAKAAERAANGADPDGLSPEDRAFVERERALLDIARARLREQLSKFEKEFRAPPGETAAAKAPETGASEGTGPETGFTNKANFSSGSVSIPPAPRAADDLPF